MRTAKPEPRNTENPEHVPEERKPKCGAHRMVKALKRPAAAKFAALTVKARALYATIQRHYVLNHGPIIWMFKRILRFWINHHAG